MKLNKINILAIALTFFVVAGCDDQFLERTPTDQGSVEGFFETEEDLLRALNGVYDVFQGSIWGGAFYMMHTHFDVMTDNAVGCCPWEYAYTTIAKGQHNPSTGGMINDKWVFGYEGIFRANSVLANLDNVASLTDASRNAIEAEARFLRAMIHGDLTNLYGDVPLVTSVLTREEALEVSRTAEAQVLEAVYADLDFAEQNLEMTPFQGDIGRPTSQSAIAVKTRLKLYNGDFAGAEEEARKIMDMSSANPNVVGLLDDYLSVFDPDNENNPEVLFDIQYTEGTQGEGNFIQVMLSPGPEGSPGRGWGSITPLDGLARAFEMTDGLSTDDSPLFDADNPYMNRDPRMTANMFVPGVSTFRGEEYDASLSGFSPFFAIRKGVDEDTGIGEDGCACNETNQILYRYADILMMFAEAVNEQDGPTSEVYDAVNSVRNRAGMPDLTAGMSQTQMTEAIRHERQVEFAWEGTRYFDLIRWEIAADVIPNATLFDEMRDERVFNPAVHNLWPIPQSEIDANPNLLQNPGY